MTVRRKVLVSGRVQGVFYRDTCRRVAQQEGVGGSARNMPDGRVEVVLEGAADSVDRVIAWCRKGTDWSQVESVEVSEEKPQGQSDFRIK